MKDLLTNFAHDGIVEWIGPRPARRAGIEVVERVQADPARCLVGDRYDGRSGKRQLTLIQAEHLPAIAALVGRTSVDPAELRRNIVVSGLNLLALKDRRFRIGGAVALYTGLCHPCTRMEEALGSDGYNSLRGHGGITARVLEAGDIAVGDALAAIQPAED